MNIIKHYRKKRQLTQAELAKECNLSAKTISRYETGEREPRVSDIVRLCEALNVTETELLNGPAQEGFKV